MMFSDYVSQIDSLVRQCIVTGGRGREEFIPLTEALRQIQSCIKDNYKINDPERVGKIVFIGNGGSAAIASHCAIDYTKNGGLRAIAFNDPATLTCLSNDYDYDDVFAKQIEYYCDPDDWLFAISSSGMSHNIRHAVNAAQDKHMPIVTLSGFKATNWLRSMGDYNFYVPSNEYGFVEISHLILLHYILDTKDTQWTANSEPKLG